MNTTREFHIITLSKEEVESLLYILKLVRYYTGFGCEDSIISVEKKLENIQ